MPYQNWNEVFSIDGAVESASATSMVIWNSDGTQSRIIGTGLTYSGNELTGGTITGLERFDPSNSTVLVAFTGGNKPVLEVLAEIQEVEDIQAEFIALSSFFDLENAEEPDSFTETLIEFIDVDGNRLQIIGTGFDPNGDNLNGTVTEMRVVDANDVVLGTSGAVSYSLEAVANGFAGAEGLLIDIARGEATNIFFDDTYSVDDNFFTVEPGSVAKAFDLNSNDWFTLDYEDIDGLVADLGAGTVIREGVTDTFTGNPIGYHVFNGSDGDDTITLGGLFDAVYGGDGTDTIYGTSNGEVLIGGRGDDTVEGGAGSDSMYGESFGESLSSGIDTLAYTTSNAGVQIDLALGTATGGHAQGDVFDGFQNITGSGFSDQLRGSIEDNVLTGGDGNDNLKGLEGDDTLNGGDGNDTLTGGGSDDTLNGGEGEDIIYGNSGEDDINGGFDNDTIYSGSGIDDVLGGVGDDYINGQGEDDILNGQTGEDEIIGGGGNDTIFGGSGNDDLFGSGNNDDLFGQSGNDYLSGAAGIDDLRGGSGDDTLLGGTGGDRLDGGTGNDTINGGADGNRDVFVFLDGYGEDRINGYEQGTDRIELDEDLWLGLDPNVTDIQSVIDIFGTLNASGSILTLDFGGSNILEIQNGTTDIDQATLGDDIVIV